MKEKKHSSVPGLLIFIVAVVAFWILTPLITTKVWNVQVSSAGEVGDLYGSFGALFSALAFIGLIYTIIQQKNQIEMQVDELKQNNNQLSMQAKALLQNVEQLSMQKDELVLQREEMKGQRAELEGQRKVMAAQVMAAKLATEIGLHRDDIKATVVQIITLEGHTRQLEELTPTYLARNIETLDKLVKNKKQFIESDGGDPQRKQKEKNIRELLINQIGLIKFIRDKEWKLNQINFDLG